MARRSRLPLAAAILVLGLAPAIFFYVKKTRAQASLESLLAEKYTKRAACPLADGVAIPDGGTVTCTTAWDGGGHVLLLGSWHRGTIRVVPGEASIDQRVAGVWLAAATDDELAKLRARADVLVATAASGGGAVVFWRDLPSRASVLHDLGEL